MRRVSDSRPTFAVESSTHTITRRSKFSVFLYLGLSLQLLCKFCRETCLPIVRNRYPVPGTRPSPYKIEKEKSTAQRKKPTRDTQTLWRGKKAKKAKKEGGGIIRLEHSQRKSKQTVTASKGGDRVKACRVTATSRSLSLHADINTSAPSDTRSHHKKKLLGFSMKITPL